MAPFCRESIECCPGIVSRYFCKLLLTISVAPVITGMTKHFMFHIFWISVLRFLYFNLFSASFCIIIFFFYFFLLLFWNSILSSLVCSKCKVHGLNTWWGHRSHPPILTSTYFIAETVDVFRLNLVLGGLYRSRWPHGLRRMSWALDCWDRGFESRRRMDVCLCVYVLSYNVSLEPSATSRSLVQRSPTKCLITVRNPKWEARALHRL
jgi:hypothetical protein